MAALNWYIFEKIISKKNMLPIVFHLARDFGNAKNLVNLITK